MRNLLVLCLLLATSVWGQQEHQAAPSDVPAEYQPPIMRDNDEQRALPESASKVAPDAAVITINGLCQMTEPAAVTSSATCQTVITRAQFEKLTDALLTNMKASMQRQLASSYPNLLAMAKAAEARGLEKSPHFQERLAFARLQILSQELVRQIDKESSQIPEKDLEDYYHDHAAEFETATLERVFIPNRKRMDPLPKDAARDALDAQRKESEEVMTRLSEDLRAQAKSGVGFMNLQKSAYTAAGLTDVPPNPSLGRVRASNLPSGHTSVLELKPGEVSKVLSDSTGHYFYKLDDKEMEAFDKVKSEIHKVLQNQHREDAIRAVQGPISTELNPAYFGPTDTSNSTAGSKSK